MSDVHKENLDRTKLHKIIYMQAKIHAQIDTHFASKEKSNKSVARPWNTR